MSARTEQNRRLWLDGPTTDLEPLTVRTQQEVAELLGISYQQVQQAERAAFYKLRRMFMVQQVWQEVRS